MSINFEQWKFLEFFDHETIVEEEGQLIVYQVNIMNNFIFSLYMEPYDQFVIITFKEKNTSHIIFEISMENIAKITSDKTTLFFYKEKNTNERILDPDYTIIVKPKVSLSLHIK